MVYFTLKDQGDKPQTYIKETSETNKVGETLRKETIVFPPVGHSNQKQWHSLSFSLRGEPFCSKASEKKRYWPTEKNGVSPAKSFALEFKLSDKSFM